MRSLADSFPSHPRVPKGGGVNINPTLNFMLWKTELKNSVTFPYQEASNRFEDKTSTSS